MNANVCVESNFSSYLILLSPMGLNWLLIAQETWEEVDPDELSYEVSWLGLSDRDASSSLYFLQYDSFISGVACIG